MENELKAASKQFSKDSYEAMKEDILDLKNKPTPFIAESINDWCQLDFIAGAKWQSEKDKVIIDKLTNALQRLLISHYKLSGGVIPTEIEKETQQLLNQLKQ